MAKLCKHCGSPVGFFTRLETEFGLVHSDCLTAFLENQKSDQQDLHSDIPDNEEAVASTEAALPTEYGTARAVSGVGEFFGWLLVLFGVVLAIISSSQDMGAVGFIMALGVSISGLYLAMMAQFVRATVNNADTSREILRLLQTRSQ